MSTPPMDGFTALSTSAWRIASWPTMAVNGYRVRAAAPLLSDIAAIVAKVFPASASPGPLPGAQRAADGLEDARLGEVVEAVVPPADPVGEVEAGVEGVPPEERGRAARREPGQHRLLHVVARRVDDESADLLLLDLPGDPLRLHERRLANHRDVAPAVADEDEQRVHAGIAQPLGPDDLEPGDQSVGQR